METDAHKWTEEEVEEDHILREEKEMALVQAAADAALLALPLTADYFQEIAEWTLQQLGKTRAENAAEYDAIPEWAAQREKEDAEFRAYYFMLKESEGLDLPPLLTEDENM